MEPFTIAGLVGLTLGPILKKAAEDHVADFVKQALKDAGRSETRKLRKAARRCLEAWMEAGLFSMQAGGVDPEELEVFLETYQPHLRRFLGNADVLEELLRPVLSGEADATPRAGRLEGHWRALELPDLPEDFDFVSASRAFSRRMRKEELLDAELRQRLATRHLVEQTAQLAAIRGVWPDFDLDAYARRMRKKYRTLDLSALTPPARDDVGQAPLLLRDVFVPQSARPKPPPWDLPKDLVEKLVKRGDVALEYLPEGLTKEDLARARGEWVAEPAGPVLDAIGEEPRLVLLGDPGSGKSTLARYVLLTLLEPPPESPEWLRPLTGHLPLLVELREYVGRLATGGCEGFPEFLHFLGKTEGYHLNHVELKAQLAERPALVVFDGLDEVFDPAQRAQVAEQIIGFAHNYEKARVIVTSRVVGYRGAALRDAGFTERTIAELDDGQIRTFVTGWYALLYSEHPEEAATRQRRIEEALAGSPAVRQLAGNPLLLTIIAIIAKHQELPRERPRLYEHAIKVLCHHWDVTGHRIPPEEMPADFMREDDKLELLRRVAWRIQGTEGGLAANYIGEADLRAEVEGYFGERWEMGRREATRVTDAMVGHLRARNFVLCLYGPGLYGFVHRTFLEYLCATEVQDRFEKQRATEPDELQAWFVARADAAEWHEVLRLLCGLLAPPFAGTLARYLPLRLDWRPWSGDLPDAVRVDLMLRLVALPWVERAVLFGSRARGDAPPRADIDLALTAPAATLAQWDETVEDLQQVETLLPLDIVRAEEAPTELTARIETEGVLLYERLDRGPAPGQARGRP